MGRAGRLRKAYAAFHSSVRGRGETPLRKATSVLAGTMIGCLPLWGGHFGLCLLVSRIFRLDVVRTYLAAHINNPLTAPFLLYLQYGVGHWLMAGAWPTLTWGEWSWAAAASAGRAVLVGSVLTGLGFGMVLAAAMWGLARRRRPSLQEDELLERVALPYLDVGVSHWEFVRGKLRYDPVYRSLLGASVSWPPASRIVDLGCGRGIALRLLSTAFESRMERGQCSSEERPRLLGVDESRRALNVARRTLGDRATLLEQDIATLPLEPPVDVCLLIDVLHYLPAEEQVRVIERAARALTGKGAIVMREPDASLGWRFAATRVAERLRAWMRGNRRQSFHYRTAADWQDLLRSPGLSVAARPMWSGTPFANVLFVASPGEAGERPGSS